MPDRKWLFSILWLFSAIVLLAAPIRSSGFASRPTHPLSLSHNFDLLQGHPTAHISGVETPDSVPEVDALASEIEEQDRLDAPDEPRASLLMAYSYRQVAARRLTSPLFLFARYPLRC